MSQIHDEDSSRDVDVSNTQGLFVSTERLQEAIAGRGEAIAQHTEQRLEEVQRALVDTIIRHGETIAQHTEQRLEEVQRALVDTIIRHGETIAQHTEQRLEQRLEEVQRALIDRVITHGNTKDAELAKDLADFEVRLPTIVATLQESQFRLTVPNGDESGALRPPVENLCSPYRTRIDTVYAQIEHLLRGPTDKIRQDQATYISQVVNCSCDVKIVVDIGCGRGEWLDAVRDAGFEALGVETNPVYASLCRSKGHEVRESDGLRALQTLEAGTARLISLFHVVEHLEFDYLVSLLVEAHRVLAPGGRLIIETPNPEALQVSTLLFWLDPTHRRPVPCLLMTLILEALSFVVEETKVLHASSSPLIEALSGVLQTETAELLVSHLDYCVVVRK